VKHLPSLSVAALVLAACSSGPSPDALAEAREGLEPNLAFVSEDWGTDWTTRTIELDELVLGVSATEPRDAIPPIDEPLYESASSAASWLEDPQPGALVQLRGEARFYPLAIMTRHEIVNDEIAGVPVAVTYCPLCNTALTFDRRVEGETLRFGVSGILRNSDLVMWDEQTSSLWQQITGHGIVGDHAGVELESVSTAIVSFGDFVENFPNGLSLSRDTGFDLDYGINRYELYSSRITPLFPPGGEIDGRYPALERVVGVTLDEGERAYPFSVLTEVRTVNDTIGGVPVAVFWGSPETLDALNERSIAASDAIGSALALDPVVNGGRLTFEPAGDRFADRETGSIWTIVGRAVEGPLAGTQLQTLPHRNEFWFAWSAFFPDGDVYAG
jgi:hypothetical protein